MTLPDVALIRDQITDEAFESAVGRPLDDYSHKCHQASLELVRSGVLGPDARVARGTCKGVGGQHSWVVLGDPYATDVVIVDPTLWSYRADVGGIWVGTAKDGLHTPHGAGSIWAWGRPPEAEGEPVELTPTVPLSKEALLFLSILGPLDRHGWAILSGAPVGGWPSAEIIAAMDDTEVLRALVPIDILGMLTDRNPSESYR